MNKLFRQEKSVQAANAACSGTLAASALAVFGLCYVLMPLTTGACGLPHGTADTGAFSGVTNPGKMHSDCQPCGGDIPTMVSLSTPDRHWCMAEAFNAALDHRQTALRRPQAQAVALR